MHANLTQLITLLTQFQAIERQIPLPILGRMENDTEHSYNLAMAAWLIVSHDKIPLDLDLVIKYALVHDLVEVYAGDTFALDDAHTVTKVDRERLALGKLQDQVITHEFASYIRQYEQMTDEESRFIYGLDKMMPAVTIIQTGITVWRDHGLTQEQWEDKFRPKIERSVYLRPYLDALIWQQKNHPELFA